MIFNHIRRSLRLKLIIASVFVEVVMLGLLIANSTRLLNKATEKHAETLLTDIPPLLNAALAPMLFERDFAAIEDFMDDLVFNPRKGITSIAIYDQTGKLYGKWGKTEGETSRKSEDIPRDALVEASFPLKLGNVVIGEVKCDLSLEHLHQSRQSLYRQGALIALSEVILTIVLLSIIAFILTRHITKLVNGARAMAQGNYSVEITIPGSNEISQLSHDFNEMAVAVNERTASLRESEEKYRSLIESLQEGIWVIDEDAKTVFVNSPMAEMLGYTEEEMLGKHLFEFMDEKAVAIAKENLKRREAGIQEQHDFEFLQKDGSKVYAILETRPVTDNDGNFKGASAGVINVTERKRAEEALREKEERYRMIIQTAMDGFWLTDTNGNFLEVNAAYAQMSGYSTEELMNMRIFDVEAGESPEEVARHIQKGIETGFDRFETVHRRKDKSTFDIEINFRYLPIEGGRFVVFLRDITERKGAEEELRESEERYRRLIELNPDGIYVCREGKIIYVNQAAIDIWGAKSEDELIGKTVFDLIHPDYSEKAKERSRLVAEKGVAVPLIDFKYLRLDKGETHVQAIVSPVIFKGEPALLSTIRDITNQRKAEAEKEKLEAQLQQAYKMEAIGTLAGGIAHDFNNILSPIMIHSEMAMMDLPPESPLQHNLKQIFLAGERARGMVKQILAFSRKEQQERTPIRFGAILKEVVKLLRSSIPTTIDIRHNTEAEMDIIFANHTQVHQVILNLCTNASHAMREKGGVLEIGLSDLYLDFETAGKFDNLNTGSYLRLTVRDTGHGIDPEVINRIFDPYFTTKETGEGTGMGLSVAHGIVKNHGGDITVESELGKGTTFHVLFPKFEEDIPQVVEQAVQLPKGTERILFVDDEKGAVDAIKLMLENLGYQLTARTSSIEALEAFRNKPDAFDLVITDMTMPNMTGKELAKEIMSIRPDIPIIICTGFSEQIDENKAKAMGISAYVMKPIVMREIANTIREVLDQK